MGVATAVARRLRRCILAFAGLPRGPAALCALAGFLVWQLRPSKIRADYQRSLLLDQPELFRGNPGLKIADHRRRHGASSQVATTRLAQIEDELRLVMSSRWFQGSGERVVDRLPPAALNASIASTRAQAAGARGQLYIWFIGSTDTLGMSWCPDCNKARPFLAPRLAELPTSAVVLEVTVSRDEWRNQRHPYRQSPVSIQFRHAKSPSADVSHAIISLICVHIILLLNRLCSAVER